MAQARFGVGGDVGQGAQVSAQLGESTLRTKLEGDLLHVGDLGGERKVPLANVREIHVRSRMKHLRDGAWRGDRRGVSALVGGGPIWRFD